MKPILFVDADDVLAPGQPACKHSAWELSEAYQQKSPELELILAGVFSGDARFFADALCDLVPELQVVISSSWRYTYQRHEMLDILTRGGLVNFAERVRPGTHWCTPLHQTKNSRTAEIAEWLARYHNGEPFAVLDDPVSGASLGEVLELEPWKGRVLLCDKGVGLKSQHIPLIAQALQQPVARRLTQRLRRKN